ncbi:hypothetical protein MASR1M74_16930 [Lentimicrobium sp.]
MPLLGSIIKSAIEFPSRIPFEKFRRLSPAQTQQATLKKLLRNAQFTAFGEAYDFGGMLRKKTL